VTAEVQRAILDFWFPVDAGKDFTTHEKYWMWRMRGGADADIVGRFSRATERAASGEFDCWSATPRGRLALIVALDQFPRSVWRGTPRAYENDPKALALTLEGLENGHFDALETVWEKAFFQMPLGHCECPNVVANVERAVEIGRRLLAEAPDHLRRIYEFSAQQPVEALKVLTVFGRHPHRNDVLGRESTAEEKAYLEKGQFPHERSPDW
jgi:uncharacterized protein (DUF924 family)